MKGGRAFERFVVDTNAGLAERNVPVDDVDLIVPDRRTVEEVVLHLDEDAGPVLLPVAIAADREASGRLVELRVYFLPRTYTAMPASGGISVWPQRTTFVRASRRSPGQKLTSYTPPG